MARRASTSTTTSSAQPTLTGFQAAIDAMTREAERQARALSTLFQQHGYDLAAGDLLYYAPGMRIEAPPQYAAQVRPSSLLAPGTVCFMKNPRYSLF